jgi:hypothetical protein
LTASTSLNDAAGAFWSPAVPNISRIQQTSSD